MTVIRRPGRPRSAPVAVDDAEEARPLKRGWVGLHGAVLAEFRPLGAMPDDGVNTAKPWERRVLG